MYVQSHTHKELEWVIKAWVQAAPGEGSRGAVWRLPCAPGLFQHFARPSHRLDSSRGGAGQGPGQAEHPSFCSEALTIPCIHLPLHPLLPLGSMLRLFKNKGFWRSFCLASFRACWDLPIRAVGAFEGNDRVLSLKTVLSPQTPRYSPGFSQTCSLPSLRTLEP